MFELCFDSLSSSAYFSSSSSSLQSGNKKETFLIYQENKLIIDENKLVTKGFFLIFAHLFISTGFDRSFPQNFIQFNSNFVLCFLLSVFPETIKKSNFVEKFLRFSFIQLSDMFPRKLLWKSSEILCFPTASLIRELLRLFFAQSAKQLCNLILLSRTFPRFLMVASHSPQFISSATCFFRLFY